MDELFDVFEAPPQTKRDSEDVPPHPKKQKKNKKRQIDGNVKGNDNVNGNAPAKDTEATSEEPTAADAITKTHSTSPTENTLPDAKRLRLDEAPAPVVADSFETEQEQQVAGTGDAAKPLIVSHQVRHKVSIPQGYPYVPITEHKPPADPAKVYSFTLDPFQQLAVHAIQRSESVLVSAHTSAGKTVVAEYAIAQSLKNNQRVIYTSPIKALSNQKYREFAAEFGDVGLMTGDVTINPTATCLVMTTEILRSMLYRGSEIMREVGWVVFDEIHYMRDANRGVVWEETLILLPDKQFADWIVKMHNQPCHVVYTNYRPTPLQHYFFPMGAEGMHLVVDEKGVFREENFQKAMSSIADKKGDDPADALAKRKGKGKDKKLDKGGLVKMIMLKSYNPVIVFSFSKRECEAGALQMKKLSFNDDSEKEMVSKVFDSAMEMLSPEDRNLQQVVNLLPLLRRGIGVHHSGLLPILKETIEILFQEGLIKVLFATETFSIGLNMPAKTVIFTSVRKFDGITQRWVTPSEFIQMSGRAGRRGLDERGIVIMMVGEEMDPAVAKEIVRGEQDRLNSAFHLSYNMILNLMRVEEISPEFMLRQCFKQFQNASDVGTLEVELKELEDQKANMSIEDEGTIREYYDLRKQLDGFADDMRAVITHPNYSLPFLNPGRLVHVKWQGADFGWGAIVDYKTRHPPKGSREELPPHQKYFVEIALQIADEGGKVRVDVVPAMLSCIHEISNIRLRLPKDLSQSSGRAALKKALDETMKRFPDGVSLVDPIEDMRIKDDSFKKLLRKIEVIDSRLLGNPLHNSPRLPELWDQYAAKVKLGDQIKEKKQKIEEAMSIIQLDELKCRKRVLRRYNFIDDNDVVLLKARVACEISTGDELMLSELLFDGFFNELTPEQVASVISCFVFEEKVKDAQPLAKDELAKPLREIQKLARQVAKVSQESKIALNEEEYVKSFHWELMEVVYDWAHGKSFGDICKMTDVYEGNLIRVFRRLEECLRQMAQASKVMGSEDLERKFEEALQKIRRDIVAAQSLYL
ncbi:rRNA-processing arch domain-containing protein [Penicillium chermesinum]|uniref:rRNA-processing arch domain-containing protein n=1 Tax=Penicillium chermesinum TaxID=63820 RepID=A0A9W9TND6_9EURO|nr:rRNA-processing arch domain-containing protein [Penicillium chermesinum]KAJ5232463.1 rRNA-processing arch domain-containing protein [Penicillium chermesinum]